MIIIKAFLVDDEQLALEYLEKQIKTFKNIEVIGKFTFFDVEEQADIIKEADVVFLDIEMPEVTGLELAEVLLQEKPDLIIIFVAAFNEYAIHAFKLNALDYILKPIEFDRLTKTIKRVEDTMLNRKEQNNATNIFLKVNLCIDLSFQINDGNERYFSWRTTKAKSLFLYLLYKQGQTVLKAELIELFWSKLQVHRAFSQLYTAIYHIRKTIRKFNLHFSLTSLDEGYSLRTSDVLIDVVEWENQLNMLNDINSETIFQWESAMGLYKGNILLGNDMQWIESERSRLELLWVNTAYRIVAYYHKITAIDKAEEWLLTICEFSPKEEHAHFELMKIYEHLGLGLLVDHRYTVLTNICRVAGIDLSDEVKNWQAKRRHK